MRNAPAGSAREQLLRLQRATFERIEDEVLATRRHESSELRHYRRIYEKEVHTYRKISKKSELIEKVLHSSIVLCGDFHTLLHSQKTALRILREVLKYRPNDVCLGLELVSYTCERYANDYVRGRMGESVFLEALEYQKRWGFPWAHYRLLFEFARKHQLRILGLNSSYGDQIPLAARDDLAADRIVKATLSERNKLIFCLYGDLHVAEPHLPQRIQMRLKQVNESRELLTIFQNSESIYWSLVDQGLESEVDVVEISDTKYCVLSAAPWIKWQSFRSWNEDQTELLGSPSAEEEDEIEPDYYHQVLDQAKKICSFLDAKPADLEQFTVLTSNDISIIDAMEKYYASHLNSSVPLDELLRASIVETGSCFIPQTSVLYLSDISENGAAEKAAQLVVSKFDQGGFYFAEGLEAQELFYRLTLWEAAGFFGSKVINHKRKCDQYADLEQRLIRNGKKRLRGRDKDESLVAKCLLSHRLKPNSRKLFLLPPRPFFMAARSLGRIMGDRIFMSIVTDQISLDVVRELFNPDKLLVELGTERYFWLLKQIPRPFLETVSKDERF